MERYVGRLILRNATDVSRSRPDELVIGVLFNGVGYPADRTSQSKYGDRRLGREPEYMREHSQSKIQIWIVSRESVCGLNQPFSQFDFPRLAILFGNAN